MPESNVETVKARIRARSWIKDPDSAPFKTLGPAVAGMVCSILNETIGTKGIKVLDFGCGSGRVALPLSEMLDNGSVHGADVDEDAVEYVRLLQKSNCTASKSPVSPPLDFPDSSFDAVYSISVWSHFDEALGASWLEEMSRVLRPGGIAIISIAGMKVVQHWAKENSAIAGIDEDYLNQSGVVFFEYRDINNATKYPGISGQIPWGHTLISKGHVEEVWSRYFSILDVGSRSLPGGQDLIVMRKPL